MKSKQIIYLLEIYNGRIDTLPKDDTVIELLVNKGYIKQEPAQFKPTVTSSGKDCLIRLFDTF